MTLHATSTLTHMLWGGGLVDHNLQAAVIFTLETYVSECVLSFLTHHGSPVATKNHEEPPRVARGNEVPQEGTWGHVWPPRTTNGL